MIENEFKIKSKIGNFHHGLLDTSQRSLLTSDLCHSCQHSPILAVTSSVTPILLPQGLQEISSSETPPSSGYGHSFSTPWFLRQTVPFSLSASSLEPLSPCASFIFFIAPNMSWLPGVALTASRRAEQAVGLAYGLLHPQCLEKGLVSQGGTE